MTDFTSKYHGHLGIPNEGSGIRIILDGDTDSIEYTSTGETLTDFLDNLYDYSHNSLDSIGIHINDFNNPHKVSCEKIGAVSLCGDEIITGNKIFSGKIELSDVSVTNNISFPSNFVFTGNGAGLTNLNIPNNIVYMDKIVQIINSPSMIPTTVFGVKKGNGIIQLVAYNDSSQLRLNGSNNKYSILSTEKYAYNNNSAVDNGISFGWGFNSISKTNNAPESEITFTRYAIKPRQSISLGSDDDRWDRICANTVTLGAFHTNIIPRLGLYGEISEITLNGGLYTQVNNGFLYLRSDKNESVFRMYRSFNNAAHDYKTITFTTNRVHSVVDTYHDTSYSNDFSGFSLVWASNNTKSKKFSAKGISFTDEGIVPITSGSNLVKFNLGDPNNYWHEVYIRKLNTDSIILNGKDVSSNILNAITQIPNNVILSDKLSDQSITSSLSLNCNRNNNPNFTLTDNNSFITFGLTNESMQFKMHDKLCNKNIKLITNESSLSENQSTALSWQSQNTIVYHKNYPSETSNINNSTIVFDDYSIRPLINFPIDLGTNEARWRNLYTTNIHTDSIILNGNDLKEYIDKATSMDKIYMLERKLDAGDTDSLKNANSYTDSMISEVMNDYNNKIDNLNLSLELDEEVKKYIDEKISQAMSGIVTHIPIVEAERTEETFSSSGNVIGYIYDESIVDDLPESKIMTSEIITLHEEDE